MTLEEAYSKGAKDAVEYIWSRFNDEAYEEFSPEEMDEDDESSTFMVYFRMLLTAASEINLKN